MLPNYYPPTAAQRFESPDAFRAWLHQNQDSSQGVRLTIAKKGSRRPALKPR
jgi:hypothetical protein